MREGVGGGEVSAVGNGDVQWSLVMVNILPHSGGVAMEMGAHGGVLHHRV